MSQKRERLKNIKTRIKYILNGETETVPLDDIYLLSTWDYETESLLKPISDVKTPIWDWFNVYNTKNKKLWYIDFSCPFVDHYFALKTFEEKMTTASIDLYYRYAFNAKKHSWANLNQKDVDYDTTVEYYKKYNNWELTFKQYEERNEMNKNWNEGIKVFKNKAGKEDFSAIMPYSLSKSNDITIKDIFIEIVSIIKKGELCVAKKYSHLIEEIPYQINLFNKEKHIERFI